MRIVKFKKIGKSKYKIFFESQELDLYEDVIIKYNLISKKDIDLDLLDKVLKDNKYYDAYNKALNHLSFKMRCEKEIRDFLEKREIDNKDIDKIIDDFKKKNLINDELYISSYINDAINLKDSGPNKIKNDLLKLNIDEYLIDKYLNKIDSSIWEYKINKYIKKHINKNMSTNMVKLKILNDLNIKGYDKEIVYPFIENISLDDESNIKNEYDKAYKKYSNKYNGRELNNKITNYLIRKGYNYSEINNLIK